MKRRTDFADFFNTYNATTKMMGGINESLQDARANEARNNATAQQTNTESNFGQQDPEAEYEGAGSDGQMTNAEAASFGVNVPEEDKTKGTGVNRLFGLGLDPKKWQSTAPTRDQKNSAGDQAKADYYRSVGRDDSAEKLEDGLYKKNLRARDDLRFAREETKYNREEAAAKREDDYRAKHEELFASSPTSLATADFVNKTAKYKKDVAAYEAQDPATRGPAPARPSMQEVNPLDNLAFMARVVDNDFSHGKLNPAQVMQFQKGVQEMRKEGVGEALKLAHGGAPVEEVAKEFAKYGQAVFDPASVTSDKMVKRTDGITTRVITYKGPDGKERTLDTAASLDSMGQADKIFDRYFRAETLADARERTRMQGAHTAAVAENTQEAREQRRLQEFDRALKPFDDRVVRAQEGVLKAVEAVTKDNPGAKQEDIAKNPVVIEARKIERQAAMNRERANADMWTKSNGKAGVGPDQYVDRILAPGVAKSPADVMKSLGEINGLLGSDFADAVGQRLKTDDRWLRMVAPPAKAATPGAPAAPAAPDEQKPAAQVSPWHKLDAAARRDGWARQKSVSPSTFGSSGKGEEIYVKRGASGALEVKTPSEMADQLGLIW